MSYDRSPRRSPSPRRYSPSPPRRRYGSRSPSPRYRRRSRSPPRRYSPRGRTNTPTNNLFIGNLPYHFRERDVIEYFERCGKIRSAVVGVNKRTGQSKGYAFVTFEDKRDAEDAFERFQGYNLEGRRLRIDWDVGLEKKFSGGGRGGGGGGPPRRRFSPPRRRYSRSPRRRSRSRSKSYSRSPSRSRSPSPRKRSASPKRSPSPKRSASRSPSPRRSPEQTNGSPREKRED